MDGAAVDAAELHATGELCLSWARQQRKVEGEEEGQGGDDLPPELDVLEPNG
jgi:hypothetical protein